MSAEESGGDVVWYYGDPDLPQLGHRIAMRRPKDRPCNGQCPWLNANQGDSRKLYDDHEIAGVELPDEPFEFAAWKRATLWDAELKEGTVGYAALCHVRLPGTELRADDTWNIVGRQCVGALVMQQRELMRHLVDGRSLLTLIGLARVASGALNRSMPPEELALIDRAELRAALHPALLDSAIGCHAVAAGVDAAEALKWRAWLNSDVSGATP